MGDDLLGLVGEAGTGLAGGVLGAGVTAGATLGKAELNPITAAGDAAAAAVEGKAEKFLWDFAQNTVDGAQVFFHMIVDLMFQITAPQVTGEFIYTMGGRIFFISLPLIVLFAAMRIIAASLRAQALTGARDAFLGAGASVLGTVALVPLTSLAVRAVDAAADGLLTATLVDGDEFVDNVMAAVVQVGTTVGNLVAGEEVSGPIAAWQVPAGGVIATCLICGSAAILLLLACAVIGLALVARNMLLYIVIVVGPLCLSGLAWEPTRRWASIWLGWMVALIFTKLAIVVVMGLGVLAITATFDSGEITANVLPGLSTVLSGILMLVLAAFMPVACFALFGWMGEGGVRELQAAASGAGGMMASVPGSALSAGQTAGGRLKSMLSGGGGSDGGQGGGGSSNPGLVGDSSDSGPVEAAAPVAEGATAVGATAATGGLATGAVVAAEVASTTAEAGEEVADATKETVGDAVSETTESGGGESYSYEQPAQDDSGSGASAESAPATTGVPVSEPATGEGGAEGSAAADAPVSEPAVSSGGMEGPTTADAPGVAPVDVPAAPASVPAPAEPPMDAPASEEQPAPAPMPADVPIAPPVSSDDENGGA